MRRASPRSSGSPSSTGSSIPTTHKCPGADPEDFDSDPILEASELHAAGDRGKARGLLMGLLATDLRCLDAHAHVGNLEFDHRPEQAVRHYEMGMKLGVFSLGKRFHGVLPWGLIDNRRS